MNYQHEFGRQSIRQEGEPKGPSTAPPAAYCEKMQRLRALQDDRDEQRASEQVEVWDES